MRDAIASWVLRYVGAWTTNDPTEIGRLFHEDARYLPSPHGKPWEGREAIVDQWIRHQDEPGTWGFRFELLGVDGNIGFVRGWTEYRDEKNYDNLWVIRLNESGECTEFTEWWMVDKTPAG